MDRPATIRPVAKHAFLSDEWFAVVEQLFEEHGADAPGQVEVLVNVTVTDTPFGDERQLHMGARDGKGHWGRGHADDADVTFTTDYETAREVLLSGDAQVGMQAFMAGKVRLQGDFAKLIAAQGAGGPGATNAALAEAILGVTQ
jgi:SCP-2 sterol transfer family